MSKILRAHNMSLEFSHEKWKPIVLTIILAGTISLACNGSYASSGNLNNKIVMSKTKLTKSYWILPPTGADGTVTALEDINYSFHISDFEFQDNDGDDFNGIRIISDVTNGTLEYDGSPIVEGDDYANVTKLVFIPNPNENGIAYATFTFKVRDNSLLFNTSASTYTMTINVTAVNDAPTFTVSDPAGINEDDGVQSISNFATSIDDGDPEVDQNLAFDLSILSTTDNLTFSSPPAIDVNNGTLTYTPEADKYGTALIQAVLSDDGGKDNDGLDSDTLKFTITVDPVNDPPTIDDISDPAAIDEDAGEQSVLLTGISPGPNETEAVSVNATSDNTTLIPSVTVNYSSGSTGSLSYTPSPNTSGTTTITVTVDDGKAQTDKKFTVTVNPVNDPPTLDPIADPAPILEDAATQSISLTGISAGSLETQTLSVSAASNNTAVIPTPTIAYTSPQNTGTLKFTPASNGFGTATITVTVDDGQSKNSTFSRQFTVTVNPVADAPSVTDAKTNENTQSTSGLVITRNTVDDSEVKFFKITNITNGTLFYQDGTTSISNGDFITVTAGNAGLRFTPLMNSSDDGSFQIQASLSDDDSSLGGGIVTAHIVVNAIPTTTGISDIATKEDGPQIVVSLFDKFADEEDADNALTFTVSQITNNQLFENYGIASGQLTFDLAKDQNGTSTVTIKCEDLEGAFVETSFDIKVSPVNDAPVFTSSPVLYGSQDAKYVYNITTADAENDTRTIGATTIPSWLSISDNKDGTATLSGIPGESDNGDHKVTLIVTDANNASTTQSFTINVNNVNDPPMITSEPVLTAQELELYEYNIEAIDPDTNDSLAFSVTNMPSWLNLGIKDRYHARLFGIPTVGMAGNYSVTIKAKDLAGVSDTQSFTIVVGIKNNEPVLEPIVINNLNEDTDFAFSKKVFKDAFSDVDNDTIQLIKIVSLPSQGVLKLNGSPVSAGNEISINNINKLVYSPKADQYGNDLFEWNAFDGKGYSNAKSTVTFFIQNINDAPRLEDIETNPIRFELGDDDKSITDQLRVVEVDIGDKISSAIVRISENYKQGEDALLFDDMTKIKGAWIDSLGVLTLSGIDSVTNYEKALRSVRYTNKNSLTPNFNARTISITATDANDATSEPVNRQVTFEDTFVALEIPSGFTPNGDQVNDTWNIRNIGLYQRCEIFVYARSGNLLFHSEGYQQEWDGTSGGQKLPAGIYYYVIELQKYKRTYKGSVTILK